MKKDAVVLNTITTVTIPKEPQVYVSISFALKDNMIDYGFLSGYGIKWLAQILYVFDIDSLEKVYDEDLIVETDEQENIIKVGSKKTGTFFGELKSNGETGQLEYAGFERFEIGRWQK